MLNDWSQKFIEDNAKDTEIKTTLVDTGEVLSVSYGKAEIPGKYKLDDPHAGEFELRGYILKNGERIYEFEQCWCSRGGLVSFLALKRENGSTIKESLWSDEEIRFTMNESY